MEVDSIVQKSLHHDLILQVLIRRVRDSCFDVEDVMNHAVNTPPLLTISLSWFLSAWDV